MIRCVRNRKVNRKRQRYPQTGRKSARQRLRNRQSEMEGKQMSPTQKAKAKAGITRPK